MDARRHLIALAALGLSLGGCVTLRRLATPHAATLGAAAAARSETVAVRAASVAHAEPPLAVRTFVAMTPIPNPSRRAAAKSSTSRARSVTTSTGAASPPSEAHAGRAAIAAANSAARETSQAQGFVGGVQVFAYDPGRVYEVWTAPLRVTTLTLAPGETVTAKAAGDTVRWQIGETQSGEGKSQRSHVMIKPLQRGLETNLVLATNRRVYLVQLRSGAPEAFNAEVTWDVGAVAEDVAETAAVEPPEPGLVVPQGPLDAGFRIAPKGRRPIWTPTAVMTDGLRTFLTFPPRVTTGEAPALFALGPDGQAQLVNYRQQGDLWVVDRVLEAAELRLGDRRHAQVVRIQRTGPSS